MALGFSDWFIDFKLENRASAMGTGAIIYLLCTILCQLTLLNPTPLARSTAWPKDGYKTAILSPTDALILAASFMLHSTALYALCVSVTVSTIKGVASELLGFFQHLDNIFGDKSELEAKIAGTASDTLRFPFNRQVR